MENIQPTNPSTSNSSTVSAPKKSSRMRVRICIWSALVVLVMLGIAYFCNSTKMEKELYGEQIGNNGLRYKHQDHIYNPKTEEILVDSIDWLHISYGDSIGILAKNGKRAYINLNTAELLTPLQYDRAWVFSNNRGVMTRNDSLYVFRRDGSCVNDMGMYCENIYEMVYFKGYLVVKQGQDQVGLIDTATNWVLQPEYSMIDQDYHHSMINTRKGEEWVLYNTNMETILRGDFKSIEVDWTEGLIVTERNGIQHLYSYEGKLVYEVIFRRIEELNYNTGRRDAEDNPIYGETNCYVYVDYNGKRGLMDRQYHVLTPPMFYDITAQTRNIFFATFGEYNADFGTLIDEHGRAIR